MENPEEILQCLEEFSKIKPKDIPRELDEYLCFVAKTGNPVYQWPVIKCLFRQKLINVISEFYETCPAVDIPPCLNVDLFNYNTMKTFILEKLDTFVAAPFTVQRICELLTTPRKQYNRIDKYMRALEKNILVVSTTEPVYRSSENGDNNNQAIVNGLESDHLSSASSDDTPNINIEEMDDTPPSNWSPTTPRTITHTHPPQTPTTLHTDDPPEDPTTTLSSIIEPQGGSTVVVVGTAVSAEGGGEHLVGTFSGGGTEEDSEEEDEEEERLLLSGDKDEDEDEVKNGQQQEEQQQIDVPPVHVIIALTPTVSITPTPNPPLPDREEGATITTISPIVNDLPIVTTVTAATIVVAAAGETAVGDGEGVASTTVAVEAEEEEGSGPVVMEGDDLGVTKLGQNERDEEKAEEGDSDDNVSDKIDVIESPAETIPVQKLPKTATKRTDSFANIPEQNETTKINSSGENTDDDIVHNSDILPEESGTALLLLLDVDVNVKGDTVPVKTDDDIGVISPETSKTEKENDNTSEIVKEAEKLEKEATEMEEHIIAAGGERLDEKQDERIDEKFANVVEQELDEKMDVDDDSLPGIVEDTSGNLS